MPKEHINDIMILGFREHEIADGDKRPEFGMVELWQLTDTPGVLADRRVLRTTVELTRLKGYWIRFPTVSRPLQFEFCSNLTCAIGEFYRVISTIRIIAKWFTSTLDLGSLLPAAAW